MRKKILFFIVPLILFGSFYVYAVTRERIEVTTYYPSPHGAFIELQCNKVSIGSLPVPYNDGQLRVEEGIIFHPQTVFPSVPCNEGELIYMGSAFHYCDQSKAWSMW